MAANLAIGWIQSNYFVQISSFELKNIDAQEEIYFVIANRWV